MKRRNGYSEADYAHDLAADVFDAETVKHIALDRLRASRRARAPDWESAGSCLARNLTGFGLAIEPGEIEASQVAFFEAAAV